MDHGDSTPYNNKFYFKIPRILSQKIHEQIQIHQIKRPLKWTNLFIADFLHQ